MNELLLQEIMISLDLISTVFIAFLWVAIGMRGAKLVGEMIIEAFNGQ